MKKIYAPWRSPYVLGTARKEEPTDQNGCVFCTHQKEDDAKHFILKRGEYCMLMLNLYPYNAGHILVVPYEHVPELYDLTPEARTELMELTSQASQALRTALKAHGTNIGMNLGEGAGGGIPEHVHMHVLPRWKGDTNFMPLLSDTKAVSTDLNEVYELLKAEF